MQKAKRLPEIERIISKDSISSQEELLKRLKSRGFICTQATLSRDLRQMGVGRIPDGTGGYKYSLPRVIQTNHAEGLYLTILPVIIDIVEAKQMLVVKTLPGNASNTASFIDSSGRFEIAGTIAGDDTILVIPRNGVTIKQVHTSLEIILPGLHDKLKGKLNSGK